MTKSDAIAASFPSVTATCLLYVSLCIFRILNALLIQTQFDPDEYWQTLEPAYCEAFGPERPCAYTWEWKRRAPADSERWMQPFEGPIRSYLSVLPTYLLYVAVRRLKWDELWAWIVPKGPVLLNAVIVAAPTDLATWYIGQWAGASSSTDPKDVKKRRVLAYCCLLCSVTSWFNGYALIRTYSNSVETMLLSVAVALVSPELFGNTSRPKPKLRTAVAFILGGLSVAVRFTSLAAFIPVGILLALQKPKVVQKFNFLLVPCALFGLVGILLSLIVDRYFFGFWTAPFLGSLHFNVIQGLGSLYGTHPWHWYLSAGIPAITGMLLPFVLYDLCMLWRGSSSCSQRNTWIIVASYIILHSMSAHKEFRFLLPILPLFCVRAGHVICDKMLASRRARLFILVMLIVPNLVALCYLGAFHQGAPIQINRKIRQLLSDSSGESGKRFSIHYLMGCHSTPLYSHLHVPSIHIDAWTLDCSPACRASPGVNCESDLFYKDPVRFVDSAYSPASSSDTCTLDNREDYCMFETRPVPDLLAVYSQEAFLLKAQLENMQFEEVDRFAHGINGLKVGPFQFGDDFASDSFRHVNLFDLLELSLEDMVLFAKPGFVRFAETVAS